MKPETAGEFVRIHVAPLRACNLKSPLSKDRFRS
jgi:hypothetical protein